MKKQIVCCAVAAVVALGASGARAQESAAVALQKAMDKPVDFTVAEAMPIDEVFRKLSAKAGVTFQLSDEALEFLPYGRQTRMKVTLKNITLSKALDRVLSQQALRWKSDDGVVRIILTEAAERLNRRASFDELKLLGVVHSMSIPAGKKPADVRKMLAFAADLDEVMVRYRVNPHRFDDLKKTIAAAETRAGEALPGTCKAWLNMLCYGMEWTWYVQGEQIIILDQVAQIERQLQRQVSLEYKKARLQEVLFDLADKAGVKLKMAPGVLQEVPENVLENVNLVMADATVGQALEALSGATGLKFARTSEGIRVEASEQMKKEDDGDRRQRPPFFVRMSMPLEDGTSVDVFMRPDDMPEEVVEYIKARKASMIRRLADEARQAAKKESGGE